MHLVSADTEEERAKTRVVSQEKPGKSNPCMGVSTSKVVLEACLVIHRERSLAAPRRGGGVEQNGCGRSLEEADFCVSQRAIATAFETQDLVPGAVKWPPRQAEKTLYLWQRPVCCGKRVGYRYSDVVLVLAITEDGVQRTQDLCAECWKDARGGKRGVRAFREEQAIRRQEEDYNLPSSFLPPLPPNLDLFCTTYVEATKEIRKDQQINQDAILGSVNVQGLEDDVEALLHHREDGIVEVSKWVTEALYGAFRGLAESCKEEMVEQ